MQRQRPINHVDSVKVGGNITIKKSNLNPVRFLLLIPATLIAKQDKKSTYFNLFLEIHGETVIFTHNTLL